MLAIGPWDYSWGIIIKQFLFLPQSRNNLCLCKHCNYETKQQCHVKVLKTDLVVLLQVANEVILKPGNNIYKIM